MVLIPARGVIGKYLGFDFYKRGKVAKVATDGTLKPWERSHRGNGLCRRYCLA